MHCILVTGSTGSIGREVISQLLPTGSHIRALSRNPKSAGLPAAVEVVAGDLTQPATLSEALDGVEAVFLLWSAPAAGVPAAIERIAKHTRRIVFLSSPHQTDHPLFQGAQPNPVSMLHAEIERLIKASGLAWAFLRPGMFAANARFWWADQIRAGNVIRWPYALTPTAPIHEHDIAAVAVHALRAQSPAGEDYVLTGPQSLSHRDQVSIIAEVVGRPLRLDEITPEQWRQERPEFSPSVASMLLAAWAAAAGQPALITSTVAEVTGRPATTFRHWAIENAAAFRQG